MSQVILVSNIEKKLERLAKELADIKKEVGTAVKVSKSQVWFWSKTWQKKEMVADKAIKADKVRTFPSVAELIEDLHK